MADWGRSVVLMWWVAILAAFLTAVGLLGLDQRVTTFSGGPQVGEDFLRNGTSLLDLLTLKNISNFLLGALLLLGAAILLAIRRARRIGWGLLYLASVQFVATVVAALSKPLFGRLRPYEVVSEAGIADTWFVGANAFPSGHTAFYAGLFFPLVLIRPRWTFVLLIPPIFIATARVVQHQHYVSDVTGSLTLAALLAIAFKFILYRRDAATREPVAD
jgi:membrane-associated phospholipid phosphatase